MDFELAGEKRKDRSRHEETTPRSSSPVRRGDGLEEASVLDEERRAKRRPSARVEWDEEENGNDQVDEDDAGPLCFGVPVSMRSKLMTCLSQRHFKKLSADLIKLIDARLFVQSWSRCDFRTCFELPSYQSNNVLSARSECSRSSEKPTDPLRSTRRD